MKTSPTLLIATALLPLASAAEQATPAPAAPADAPAAPAAPTAEQLASPLPPVSFSPETLQTMQDWVDTLRAIGSILNSGKEAEAIAAELEALEGQAKRHGSAVKGLTNWRRSPSLELLGLNNDELEAIAAPMYACREGGYQGSRRLEAAMDMLAEHLLPNPLSDTGTREPLGLTPPQVVQEYLSIVHGVRVALAEGQSLEAREAAMWQLRLRAYRLGELSSDDDFDAIHREIERRMPELEAAHKAALPLLSRGKGGASPRLEHLLDDFSEQMAWVSTSLFP